jgi:hypothetical protein
LAVQGGTVHEFEHVAGRFGHPLRFGGLVSELQKGLAGLELLKLELLLKDLSNRAQRQPAQQ